MIDPSASLNDLRLKSGRHEAIAHIAKAQGIHTVGELWRLDMKALAREPNIGRKTIAELRDIMPPAPAPAAESLESIIRRIVREELDRKFP